MGIGATHHDAVIDPEIALIYDTRIGRFFIKKGGVQYDIEKNHFQPNGKLYHKAVHAESRGKLMSDLNYLQRVWDFAEEEAMVKNFFKMSPSGQEDFIAHEVALRLQGLKAFRWGGAKIGKTFYQRILGQR